MRKLVLKTKKPERDAMLWRQRKSTMLWRQRKIRHVVTSERDLPCCDFRKRAVMLWRHTLFSWVAWPSTPHNSRSCVSGYAQHIRDGLGEINILQNLQMARLCDIAGAMMFVQLEGHRATQPDTNTVPTWWLERSITLTIVRYLDPKSLKLSMVSCGDKR